MSQHQRHILIVERNDVTRKLLSGILKSKGYDTFEATNGDEALAFFAKDVSLLLLDVEGNPPDNMGLIRKLQMEHHSMPLIAMTDEEDVQEVQERLNLQLVTVMTKPVMPDLLVAHVSNSLLTGIDKKMAEEEGRKALQPRGPEVIEIDEQRKEFMRHAIDLAQEKMDANCGGPFGAVIVQHGKVIGEGWSEVTSKNDPTAHAVMMAIRHTAQDMGDYSLEGTEIYTNCEPCPMCLAAIYWARIDRIFYASTREDAESIGFDDDFIYREMILPEHKRTLPSKMVCRDEAQIVFENWTKKPDKTPY